MAPTVPDILARIAASKAGEIAKRKISLDELESLAELRMSERRDFCGSLRMQTPAVIAEIKRASPSRGTLASTFNPEKIARSYEAGGAAALSVLTDRQYFQGSLADLEAARTVTNLPVLRKDFTLDGYDVVEAAAHSADAILLIAALLTPRQLRDLRELAARYRMAALVEVHDASELEAAEESGAGLIGVNNRNLHTFEVSLEVSLNLAHRIPASAIKVSESGIRRREDIDRLRAAGFDGFLVGEHLMRATHPQSALEALTA